MALIGDIPEPLLVCSSSFYKSTSIHLYLINCWSPYLYSFYNNHYIYVLCTVNHHTNVISTAIYHKSVLQLLTIQNYLFCCAHQSTISHVAILSTFYSCSPYLFYFLQLLTISILLSTVAHHIYGTPLTINSANYVYFLGLQKLLQLDHPEATTVFTGMKIIHLVYVSHPNWGPKL